MSILEQISVAMKVIDSAGRTIGKVDYLRTPNPKAAALAERIAASPQNVINLGLQGLVGPEPRVPPEMARRLYQQGYIKINGRGLWSRNAYVAADAIDRVEERCVYLNLSRDELDAQE